jgi:tetratricopeptide (TPR) repeat protein
VAVDRDEILKKAEKLLKQGKMAAAIEEYLRLVEGKPDDWNSANALGDLYVKAGQADRAAEQFNRAADHLYDEGFFPRASALYKKVLKVRSNDDHALWQLADIAGRNGLLLGARSHYNRLVQDRRAAGNEQGAVDCEIRLGQLADATVDAKRLAAKAFVDRGEIRSAARLIRGVADLHTKEGRVPEGLEALREAARLDPDDAEIQAKLATAASVEEPAPPVEAIQEPIAELEPIVEAAAVEAAEALPLESFFEELRGKVARDQEVRAREQLAPVPEDRVTLMYDLADTLARQGEGSRAMALFLEIESKSSGYRDVRDRIAQLSRTEIGKS